MNFFGHAGIAGAFSTEPDFVLGAMLPDLRAMAGISLAGSGSPALEAGRRLHHATDALYHAHPLVVARMAREARRLRELGFDRHRARALAHVGVELVSDGRLGREARRVASFEAAVRRAGEPEGPIAARIAGDEDRLRWRRVLERLGSGDFPGRYREPGFVASRLEIVLGRRPRLALAPGSAGRLEAWVASFAADMADEIDRVERDLLVALRSGADATIGPSVFRGDQTLEAS